MKPAFGYLRVSDPKQATAEKDGLVRQEKAIRDWAKANGYVIVKIYSDAKSGAKELEHRLGYFEMLAHLKAGRAAGQTNTVIIEKLDRLARSLLIQESIVADFRRHGYELLSTAEPDLCSEDPTRVLFRQIMGAIAQYDAAMIAMRMKAAWMRKRLDPNHFHGRPSYGFTSRKGKLIAIEGSREVVRLILQMRGEGKPLLAIADALVALGHEPPKTSKRWYAQTIRRIVLANQPKLGPMVPPAVQTSILEPGKGQNDLSA